MGGGYPGILKSTGIAKYQGENDRVEKFPGSGGALAFRPHAKKSTKQETKNQKMLGVEAEHRGVQGEGTRDMKGPNMDEPPGG